MHRSVTSSAKGLSCDKWFWTKVVWGANLVAKTGLGGPSLAAKSCPGGLLLATKGSLSVPKVVRD